MKHATDKALDKVEELLAAVRAYADLKEKKRYEAFVFEPFECGVHASDGNVPAGTLFQLF